jgi:hypothetical protein
MRKLLLALFTAILLLSSPVSAKACNIRPHAKSYVNKIHKLVGNKKPSIVFEDGIDKNRFAFYRDGVIHVYQGDYKATCSEATPLLKSVIAHEYTHHLENKLAKVLKMRGERLAYVGEHAIGDEILGDAFYDNDLKQRDIKAYTKLRTMLKTTKLANGTGKLSKTIFTKKK